MGCYINPSDRSKEDWLDEFATPIVGPHDPTDNHVAVCLVNNGAFTAAGIGYCHDEVQEFAEPDGRRKRWYWVLRKLARLVSPLAQYEAREGFDSE